MRLSCNGCRILRKGCTDNCTLQSCLQWIKSPEAQSNATLFLAKFYGRAGLVNLINAAPSDQRPQIFKSLMYEACGRLINPVYGSLGLMCTGNWPRCQAAVNAVLNGTPLTTQLSDENVNNDNPSTATQTMHQQYPTSSPQVGCNIRHVSKDALHRSMTRTRFKRSGPRSTSRLDSSVAAKFLNDKGHKTEPGFTITGWDYVDDSDHIEELERASSHDSVQTVEPALRTIVDDEPVRAVKTEPSEVDLDLSLGLNLMLDAYRPPLIDINSYSES